MGTFEDWMGVVLRISLNSVFACLFALIRTCLYLAYIVPLCALYFVIILTTSVVIYILLYLVYFPWLILFVFLLALASLRLLGICAILLYLFGIASAAVLERCAMYFVILT